MIHTYKPLFIHNETRLMLCNTQYMHQMHRHRTGNYDSSLSRDYITKYIFILRESIIVIFIQSDSKDVKLNELFNKADLQNKIVLFLVASTFL